MAQTEAVEFLRAALADGERPATGLVVRRVRLGRKAWTLEDVG